MEETQPASDKNSDSSVIAKICQGHVLKRCDKSREGKCTSDEFNKNCIGYLPIAIMTFIIQPPAKPEE